ncbi:uncharacterized protein LOC18098471 [Populus trichocarpa]|uniref:uncharacterized protein LOC18098471 n=1 Tax=Populus trichocarpa TaxID=3694 RepID=UPI000D18A56C|nr:uncharacterized protein LOC18098471 [Populus trichocarpa]|eukprot:XP_024458025.1 uncharacterized protein LOC18098471 [Populus trichocarpa]
MFVSDARLNISKEDDDIQDQAENRPHLNSTNNHCIKKKKKYKFMVTNKNKKKKKKDVSFRESYSTSDHRSSGGGGGGGGGNIDFNKPTKVIFFPFNNPNKFFYKKSSPFSPSSSSSTAAVSGNACFPGPEYTLLAINLNKLLLLNSVLSASCCYVNCLPLGWRIGVGSSSMI